MKRMGTHRLGLIGAVTSALLLTSILLNSPSAVAQTYVEGEIAGVQDWIPANSPYVATGDLYVTGTLTIQPGVEVLFDDGVALYVENQMAAGTVLFNRNVTNPNPWQGLMFNSTSTGSVLVGSNVTGSMVGVFIETAPTPPLLSGTTIYNTGAALIINESSVSASALQLQDSIIYSVVLSHSNLTLENSTAVTQRELKQIAEELEEKRRLLDRKGDPAENPCGRPWWIQIVFLFQDYLFSSTRSGIPFQMDV